MFKKILFAGIAGLGLSALLAAPASADTLQDVIDEGKLTVGVKADYAPWGMRDANGNLVGLEIDLMKDLAKRIGEMAGKEMYIEPTLLRHWWTSTWK